MTVTLSTGRTFTFENIKGADGNDGISPKVRINAESGLWEISEDDGNTWVSTAISAIGKQGPQGIQGIQGEKGDKGDQGEQGIQGEKGDNGADGISPIVRINTSTGEWEISTDNGLTYTSTGITAKGDKGDKGDTGAQGEKGDQGEQGIQGEKGVKGDKGDTGATGAQGEQGIQGIQGVKGDTGEQGLQGEKGEKGDKGDKGETGAQGGQGDKGDKGDKGDQGVSVTGVSINDDNKLVITLSEGDPIIIDKSVVGSDGKDGNGIASVTLTADFYLVFNYTDGTSSDRIGPIKGEKGQDGTNGTDGLTPILTLDESGNLSVKYGASGAVTLLGNIKGIKGDKGDKGDNGANGSNGVNGKSAYELYIAAHPEYTGTQAEWLAALKGEKGDTGRGIEKAEIVNGELIITYTDGTTQNAGKVKEDDYTDCLTFNRLDDGTLSVRINADYKSILEEITIPSNYYGMKVTSIASSGFSGCKFLKTINIPSSINVIERYAFSGCSKLEKITLPSNLEIINDACFYECTNLKEITIPANVKKIKGGSVGWLEKSGVEKVHFENAENWYKYISTTSTYEPIESSVLEDSTRAAELLKQTYGSDNYYTFEKKDN